MLSSDQFLRHAGNVSYTCWNARLCCPLRLYHAMLRACNGSTSQPNSGPNCWRNAAAPLARRDPLTTVAVMKACTAALLLFCAAVSAETAQVDWCSPLARTTEQPCPNAKQCCAVWVSKEIRIPRSLAAGFHEGLFGCLQGICGTGSHYCKKGHCARGACDGAPVAPESNGRPPPSMPVEVVPAETSAFQMLF